MVGWGEGKRQFVGLQRPCLASLLFATVRDDQKCTVWVAFKYNFILILGQVGRGNLRSESNWIGSKKLDPSPTLNRRALLAPALQMGRQIELDGNSIHSAEWIRLLNRLLPALAGTGNSGHDEYVAHQVTFRGGHSP